MTVNELLGYIHRCAAHDGVLRRSGPWLSKVTWGDVQMNFYGGEGAPPLVTAPHSHARGFHSRVLHGVMLSVRSHILWSEFGTMRAFRIERDRGAASYIDTESVHLSLAGIDVISAGQEYDMPQHTVHCASTTEPTITLVEMEVGLPPVSAHLVLPEGTEPPDSTPLVDAAEDWSHVDALLKLLEEL